MAESNTPPRSSSVKKTEVAPPVRQDKINKYVRVQSLISAHFIYNGRVSGQRYEWPKSGDIVSVLEEDVSDLLSKRLGAKSCCGDNTVGNQIFQLAQ